MEKVKSKKKYGIWIDMKEAHIVKCKEDKEVLKTINSNVEFYNPKGGSRSKTKWGPQDVVQDSKYLERQKHQLKRYFDKIMRIVEKADAIALFGPADTYLKLKEEMMKHPEIGEKIVLASNTDSMSKNKIKAMVREFYKIE